jgi:two-component system, NarL family, response regulator DevR
MVAAAPRGQTRAVSWTTDDEMNVFVVEDAEEIRKRLVAILRAIPGVDVVGEAGSVRGAVDGALATAVEVMLLDLQLADGSGLEVLAALKPQRPDLYVIVLSNFASQEQYRDASLAAGADVVLDKTREFGRVREILRGRLDAQAGMPC